MSNPITPLADDQLSQLKTRLEDWLTPKEYEGWEARETWQNKLTLINSLFPVLEYGKWTWAPRAWLESVDLSQHPDWRGDLESLRGKLTTKQLYDMGTSEWVWRRQQGHERKLWFATLDYMATGEGHLQTFRAFYAWDEADALAVLSRMEDEYWLVGFYLSTTFPEGSLTEQLVSKSLADRLKQGDPGLTSLHLSSHFNYA